MKVLVTGAAGFLGSNLCELLLKKGFQVLGVDDLSTGNRDNLQYCFSFPSFEFLHHDIVYPFDRPADYIYNLASPASPPRYQADPIGTMKTNVIGTLNMLELAKKYNAFFLQASTSEVYGDPEVHPQEERYVGHVNPIGIRACYDEGKRAAETLCFDFMRMHKLDIRVARIFNTYGPYMDPEDGRVVSNFIVRGLRHQPLEVYGDGSQTRSFCYVDDMVAALYVFMMSPRNFTFPVNLGNPEEFKVIDLAHQVIEMLKSSSDIVFKDLPLDDPARRRPDIARAKSLLEWEPTISLSAGLLKTIDYFRSRIISVAPETSSNEAIKNQI